MKFELTTGTVAASRARDTPSASASVFVPARFAANAEVESFDDTFDASVSSPTVLSAAATTNASIENPILYPVRDSSSLR